VTRQPIEIGEGAEELVVEVMGDGFDEGEARRIG